MTEIYVTKYALSRGIQNVEVKIDPADTIIHHGYAYYRKGDWFLTAEEAIADAEARRVKKIASLEKQITALWAKVFVVKDGTP